MYIFVPVKILRTRIIVAVAELPLLYNQANDVYSAPYWRDCIIALVGCGKPGDSVMHVHAFYFILKPIIHLNYHAMKKFIFKLALVLTISTSLLGCSSDDSNTDLNPIENPNPTPQVPKKIRISKVTILQFPALNPLGDWWDFWAVGTAKNPDIYLKLTQGNTTLYQSSVVDDADYTQTYYDTFSPPLILSKLSDIHDFSLYDEDSGTSEFMVGVYFVPNQLISDTPSSIYLNHSEQNFKLKLDVTYEY